MVCVEEYIQRRQSRLYIGRGCVGIWPLCWGIAGMRVRWYLVVVGIAGRRWNKRRHFVVAVQSSQYLVQSW